MSGFLPSIVSLIQGVGEKYYRCNTVNKIENSTAVSSIATSNNVTTVLNVTTSKNTTVVEVEYLETFPLFSAQVFFFIISALMLLSLFSFILLVRYLKKTKSTEINNDSNFYMKSKEDSSNEKHSTSKEELVSTNTKESLQDICYSYYKRIEQWCFTSINIIFLPTIWIWYLSFNIIPISCRQPNSLLFIFLRENGVCIKYCHWSNDIHWFCNLHNTGSCKKPMSIFNWFRCWRNNCGKLQTAGRSKCSIEKHFWQQIEKSWGKYGRLSSIMHVTLLKKNFITNIFRKNVPISFTAAILQNTTRSSHWRCSIRKGVLRPATLLKKRLRHRSFPVNFAKFLRTPFLQNTSGQLLLYHRPTLFEQVNHR